MSPSTEMYTKATRRIHRVLHTTHIRFYTRFYRRNWLIATCHGKRGIPETNEESTTLMVSPGIYQPHSDGPSRKGIVRVTGIRRKLAFCTYRVPHTAKNLETSDASWKRQRRVSAPFRIFPWERLRQVAPDLQKIMPIYGTGKSRDGEREWTMKKERFKSILFRKTTAIKPWIDRKISFFQGSVSKSPAC